MGDIYNLGGISNGVDIYGNLFIGYGNSGDANFFKNLEDNRNVINDYILNNPENEQKFRSIDINKRNIYINSDKTVKHMCSGHEEDITKRQCLDKNLFDKYDLDKNKIPKFYKDSQQVYYNHDSKPSGHNELTIGGSTINKTHLDMINGKMAIKFNTKADDSQKGGEIKSYNVEYAERPGFANVVQKTFYMTDEDQELLKAVLKNKKTCYDQGKTHTVFSPYGKAGMYSGSFYMKPKPPKSDSYSHIHKHKDS